MGNLENKKETVQLLITIYNYLIIFSTTLSRLEITFQ